MRTRLNYWGYLLTCLIAVMLIIPGVSAQDTMESPESVSRPAVVIGDCMNVLVKDATSASDLRSSGIVEPEDLKIPEMITRYDLVTFDHTALNREIQDVLSIQIHGTDYSVALNRMTFENLDDGIDSYEGSIPGVEESSVLLTTGENVLVGSITLGNKTLWITPVEPRARAEKSLSPLHIIYSSEDVKCQEKPAVIDYGPVVPGNNGSASGPDRWTGLQVEGTDQYHTANILVPKQTYFDH